MTIKAEYMLHELGDENIVIPVGAEAATFNGMVRLNETGVFLWKLLLQETSREALIAAMLAEYDADEMAISGAVDQFVALLKENQFLEG